MISTIRRQNLGIDVGGLAVLSILGLIFFFQSVRPWMLQDQAAQAQRKQFLSLRQRAASAASQVRHLSSALKAERQASASLAVAGKDVRHLNSQLASIAALASKRGMQLRNIEPGRPSAEADRVELPIHLTGVAGYRDCAAFLHALRDDFPDTSVSSLRLSAHPDGDRTLVDFDINLRWYATSAVASAQN